MRLRLFHSLSWKEVVGWIGLIGLLWSGTALGQDLAIENEILQVEWQSQAQQLRILYKPSGQWFVSDGQIPFLHGRVQAFVGTIADLPLGSAVTLELRQTDGSGARIFLFPKLPFAFLQPIHHNGEDHPITLRSIEMLQATVLPGTPLQTLQTLGTAGLTSPQKNPGSYVFLTAVQPQNRSGTLWAWLTQDIGSGLVFSSVQKNQVQFRARLDYGRLYLSPGQSREGDLLAVGYFPNLHKGLETYADLVARWYNIHLPPRPDGYCTWYSRPHGGACDEKHLLELARFIARELKPFGMRFIQIDDGWQAGIRKNGPRKVFLQHNPKGPYPHGLKPVAQELRKLGLIPGLWFMPFAGNHHDPFFADKQDWFVKSPDGTPYEVRWGGTCLDMTVPAARMYLSNVVDRIVHQWSFGYLKLDGLWTGLAAKLLYVNNGYRPDDFGEPAFHDPTQTPVQIYRSGLRLLRQVAGPDVFLLGCNVSQNMRSMGASFGLVDAMRIGPDNNPTIRGLTRGPWHAANRYFLNGRVWYNDPDVLYVRPSMPIEHARLLCSWTAVAGVLTVASDWLPALPPARLDILKRILPSHTLPARPIDLFESDLPRVWMVQTKRDTGPQYVIGFFNWDPKQPLRLSRDLAWYDLPGNRTYVGFDFWANRFVEQFSGKWTIQVPAGSCKVLSLRPVQDFPLVVSTSRHVTQGLVDLDHEAWDSKTYTLHGTSHVVQGDLYELRIWIPNPDWQVRKILLSTGQKPYWYRLEAEGHGLRVGWIPDRTGKVDWSIQFRP